MTRRENRKSRVKNKMFYNLFMLLLLRCTINVFLICTHTDAGASFPLHIQIKIHVLLDRELMFKD